LENYVNGPQMPMGLGMALAENMQAMQYFAALPDQKKQAVIDHTHQIQSKQEMRQFVQELPSGRLF
jgi:uncharacterized protein YdeI (YjbR/CyaY-like superfamily)